MIEIKRNAQNPSQAAQERPQRPIDGRTANNIPEAQNTLKRPLKPFTAIDGSNYRAAYRAVCEFHERNNPPRIDADDNNIYWVNVWADMEATADRYNHDPFVMGMLAAVFEELERQYKMMEDEIKWA